MLPSRFLGKEHKHTSELILKEQRIDDAKRLFLYNILYVVTFLFYIFRVLTECITGKKDEHLNRIRPEVNKIKKKHLYTFDSKTRVV